MKVLWARVTYDLCRYLHPDGRVKHLGFRVSEFWG